MNNNRSNRFLALDGLRVLAIVSVVLFHMGKAIQAANLKLYPGILSVLDFGKYGVQLFFCISGFVISLSLSRHKSSRAFFRSRILRLWPSLIVVNSIILIYNLIESTEERTLGLSLIDFFFSNMLLDPKYVNTLSGWDVNWTTGVLWSLSIEIFFYIASAIGWYLFKVESYVFISGLVVSYSAFHFIVKLTISQEAFVSMDALVWEGLILYLPWFVVGSCMFKLVQGKGKTRLAKSILSCSLLFLELAVLQSRDFVLGSNRGVHLFIPLLFVCLTWVCIASNRLEAIADRKFILFLAKVSYDLYLSHEFIIRLVVVRNSFTARFQISALLLTGILLLIAVTISCLVAVFTYELSKKIKIFRVYRSHYIRID
jgi:peptidoglycan/LPS O-acetylase OafA/YrhL